MKKLFRSLAALVLAVATLSGCTPSDPSAASSPPSAPPQQSAGASQDPAPAAEKVVVGAISSPWTNLYPYEISGTYDEIMNILIFDRLIDVSMDGDLVPREATEVTPSADGKTLTVALSKDAHWHDGQPVTADDVVWSLQISCNPELSVSRRYLMNILDGTDDDGAQLSEGSLGVSKVDDYTIEMKLKKAMDPVTVFNTLKQFVVLPKHLLGDIPLAEMHTNEFWRSPIGSGPFMYDKEVTGERIELVKNTGYEYGPIDIDRLILRVVPAANMVSGLISGEIDLNMGSIGPIQPVDYATLQDSANLTVESVPCFDFQYMAINDARDYLTDDVKRAMNMAIDKQLIVDQLLYGQGTVMRSVWPETHPYYADLDWDTYDPEAAAQLVKDAGWDTERELLMLVPTGNTVREQSAAIIQQNLADVGIKVRIQTSDFATVMSECFKGNMDLALLGSSGTVEPHEVSTQFAPGTTTCFSNLQTSEYYDLFQKALEYTSYDERYPIYKQFQELFNERTPYVTLYSRNMIQAYSTRLGGLDTRDFCQTNFAIWNWTVQE